MSTEFDSFNDTDRLSETGYKAIGGYLLILGVLSIISNAFVILVLVRGKAKFHSIHNMLIVNISVSDLLLSSVAYPLWSSTSFYGRWIWPDAVCTFSGFWCFLLAQNDMNTLAAIAILRYIIVCKPEYEYYLKKPRAKIWILGLIWGHTLSITSMPLFGLSTYQKEAFQTSCSIDWTSNTSAVIVYNVLTIVLCYVLHLVIFSFCYFNILKTLKTNLNCLKKNPHETVELNNILQHHKMMTSRNVTLTSLSMVLVFSIAWTPYAVVSVYVMLHHPVAMWVLVLPTMFAKSCTLLNPLVCALMSSKFRLAARNMFRKNNVIQPVMSMPVEENPPRDRLVRNSEHFKEYSAQVTQDNIYIGEFTITLPVEDHLV